MIQFEELSWKNFLSTGNTETVVPLNTGESTIILGKNGGGKCLRGSTEVDVRFKNDEASVAFKKFLEEN